MTSHFDYGDNAVTLERFDISLLTPTARAMLKGIDDILAYRLRLRRRFRRLDFRDGLLIHGSAGWSEISPFWDYGPAESFSWLFAGLEGALLEDGLSAYGLAAKKEEKVPVNVTIPVTDAHTAYDLVINSGGCRTAKIKIADCPGSLDDDLQRIQAVDDALGELGFDDAVIRLDVNAAWSADYAIEVLEDLRKATSRLDYIEQPCATISELAKVRAVASTMGIRIAADESIRRHRYLLDVAQAQAADVLIAKWQPLGGLQRLRRLRDEYQLPIVISSALESSVGLAHSVRAASLLAGDSGLAHGLGTAQLFYDDVTAEPLLPHNGYLDIRPVEPDMARISDDISQLTYRWAHRLNTIARYAEPQKNREFSQRFSENKFLGCFKTSPVIMPTNSDISAAVCEDQVSGNQIPYEQVQALDTPASAPEKQTLTPDVQASAPSHPEKVPAPKKQSLTVDDRALASSHLDQIPTPNTSTHLNPYPPEESQATLAARAMVTALIAQGVRDIVICPGSRNAPLTYAVKHAADQGLVRAHVRIDERSAAFFALGLAKAGRADDNPDSFRAQSGCVPVALMMTSGTAVMNAHPAVSEACHSWTPLIIVSADRPEYLQGKAANQTTRQWDAFGSAVRWRANLEPHIDNVHALNDQHQTTASHEVETTDKLPSSTTSFPSATQRWHNYATLLVHEGLEHAFGISNDDPGPIHINMQFEEPLVESVAWQTPATDVDNVAHLLTHVINQPRSALHKPHHGNTDNAEYTADAATQATPRYGYEVNRRGLSREHGLALIGREKLQDSLSQAINPGLRTVIVACDPGAPNRAAAQRIVDLSERTGWPLLAEPSSFARAGALTPCDYQSGLRALHKQAVDAGLANSVAGSHNPAKRHSDGSRSWDNTEASLSTMRTTGAVRDAENSAVPNMDSSGTNAAPTGELGNAQSKCDIHTDNIGDTRSGNTGDTRSDNIADMQTSTTSTGHLHPADLPDITNRSNASSPSGRHNHDGIEQVIVLGHPTLSRPITRLVESQYVHQIRVSPWGTVFDTGDVADAIVTSLPDDAEVDAIVHAVDAARATSPELRTSQEALNRIVMEGSAPSNHFGFFGEVVSRIWEHETQQPADQRYPLMLGSSNSIRIIDRCAVPTPSVAELPLIFTNRGLAGIDGTIATTRGLQLRLGVPMRAIMGDLTFLHDASSLLSGALEEPSAIQIFVLNDRGGTIFRDLEYGRPEHQDGFERFFLTPQLASIEDIARGFHVAYTRVTTLSDIDEVLARPIDKGIEVVEVIP